MVKVGSCSITEKSPPQTSKHEGNSQMKEIRKSDRWPLKLHEYVSRTKIIGLRRINTPPPRSAADDWIFFIYHFSSENFHCLAKGQRISIHRRNSRV